MDVPRMENRAVHLVARLALLALLLPAGVASGRDPAPRDRPNDRNTPAESRMPSMEDRLAALEEVIRFLQARILDLENREPVAPAGPAPGPAPSPATDAGATATASATSVSFFDKTVMSGSVDAYYGFNFNRPASHKNALRNFDVNHNQFSLNLLEFAIERSPEPFGFRADFNFGDAAKMVHAAEPAGTDLHQFLQQAYISYKAPVGKGLTIDVGKFVTPLGAELIETAPNYNYSRSLLFAWAVPYYHFGARITYPASDRFSVSGTLVNGWNDVVDNNGGKTVGLGVSFTPVKRISIAQNYMVGAEQPGNDTDKRHVFDTVVTLTASDRVTLMANYDYGMDRVGGERVRYQGVAGYARVALTKRFSVSPRVEWFHDHDGFATGLNQTLGEATFTSEFKLRESVLARAEYRRDWSNRSFFETSSGRLSRSQQTAVLGLIYLFGLER